MRSTTYMKRSLLWPLFPPRTHLVTQWQLRRTHVLHGVDERLSVFVVVLEEVELERRLTDEDPGVFRVAVQAELLSSRAARRSPADPPSATGSPSVITAQRICRASRKRLLAGVGAVDRAHRDAEFVEIDVL